MILLRISIFWILIALCALLLFVFGWLVGSGHALDEMQRQAIVEGYALRDKETGRFRWKTSDDWKVPSR